MRYAQRYGITRQGCVCVCLCVCVCEAGTSRDLFRLSACILLLSHEFTGWLRFKEKHIITFFFLKHEICLVLTYYLEN